MKNIPYLSILFAALFSPVGAFIELSSTSHQMESNGGGENVVTKKTEIAINNGVKTTRVTEEHNNGVKTTTVTEEHNHDGKRSVKTHTTTESLKDLDRSTCKQCNHRCNGNVLPTDTSAIDNLEDYTTSDDEEPSEDIIENKEAIDNHIQNINRNIKNGMSMFNKYMKNIFNTFQ